MEPRWLETLFVPDSLASRGYELTILQAPRKPQQKTQRPVPIMPFRYVTVGLCNAGLADIGHSP